VANVVETYVAEWLIEHEPAQIEAWARRKENLVDLISAANPGGIAQAKRYLGSRGQRAAREASALRILGRLRGVSPDHAQACMNWWGWFVDQIERARGVFLGAAAAPRPLRQTRVSGVV